MFNAVQNTPWQYVLCGIIWALALGFAVGNYACSLVFRLPRGRLLLDKTPYCGNCGALLKVRDLFPVVSALLLRHRCRYCKAPFPVSHTWTEVLVGLLFVLAYLQYNFSEQFILLTSIGVFLITLAAIEANERIIMGRILLCVMIFGMLYRVLQDHTIYGFFESGGAGLIIGLILKYREVKPQGHIYTLPKLAELLAVGGLCVGLHGLPVFLSLFASFYLLQRIVQKKTITMAFGFAVMLPLLYPQLETLVIRLGLH